MTRPAPMAIDGDCSLSTFRRLGLALVALTLVLGLAGIDAIPAESHEIYVLLTAQEMHDRGEWILPYCEGKPRLEKPPMSYWLAALFASLRPGPFHVEPRDGRLPSVIAAALLVALTLAIGRRLFSRTVALAAGAMLATSSGFLYYAHSARPDLLFATCGALILYVFLAALDAPDGSHRRLVLGYAMWVAIAVANLVKGPLVPACLLVGFVGFLWSEGAGRRRALEVLRPLGGPILFVALSLPWWVLVQHRLAAVAGGSIEGTPLAGSEWRSSFPDVWKVTRMAGGLVVPWLWSLLPMVIALPWTNRYGRSSLKLLAWAALPLFVVLCIYGQQRHHYQLPLLPAMALLFALALDCLLAWRPGPPVWWRWYAPAHALVAAVALVWLALHPILEAAPAPRFLWPLPLVLALGGIAVARRAVLARSVIAPVALTALVIATAFVPVAMSGPLWGIRRFEVPRLAREAGRLAGDAPLVGCGVESVVVTYYGGRRVTTCETAQDVARAIALSPTGRAVAVVAEKALERVRAGADLRVVDTSAPDEGNDRYLLLELRPRAGAGEEDGAR